MSKVTLKKIHEEKAWVGNRQRYFIDYEVYADNELLGRVIPCNTGWLVYPASDWRQAYRDHHKRSLSHGFCGTRKAAVSQLEVLVAAQ